MIFARWFIEASTDLYYFYTERKIPTSRKCHKACRCCTTLLHLFFSSLGKAPLQTVLPLKYYNITFLSVRNPLLTPPSPPSHLFFNQAHHLFLHLLACATVPDTDYKSSLYLLEEGMLKIARYKGNQS